MSRLLVFLFFLSPLALSAPEFYEHTESRLRFPMSLGEFGREEVLRFPDKKLGVGVTYTAPGLGVADFYVFDYGLSPIPDGPDSELVRKAFLSAERDLVESSRRGDYADLTVTSSPGATMQVRPKAAQFRLTTYKYRLARMSGQPVVSWLLVTGARQHFLKIRYTCAASNAAEGRRALERLLMAFFETNEI